MALAACAGEDDRRATAPAARPVTVLTTRVAEPDTGAWILGVASPYRADEIAFEVGGRLTVVEELGRELRGPSLDDEDRVIAGQEGEPIARLDTARFDQALRSAQLALASAQKGLEAQRIDAEMAATSDLAQAEANEKIAAQDLTAAEANERTARARLERTREQFEGQIASQAVLDSEQSAYVAAASTLESARQALLAATSGHASARAKARLKQAQVDQALAEIAELEQRVRNAERDLADCTLLAPYAGRITAVHAGRGGVVQPGAPIVTLTAMNPMQVSVTVSAERSRSLMHGQQVVLRPRELADFTDDQALYGVVAGKAEVADAATRTYRIDVMVRNLRRSRTPQQADGRPVAVVEKLFPVMRAEPGRGPLFVGTDCVLEEDGRTWVYRLPGLEGFRPRSADVDQVLRPERVEVEVQPGRLTFVNFKFVRIADGSPLQEGDALIREPRPEQLGGVTLERHDWAIRPGDLVPVRLQPSDTAAGIYVPVDAVVARDAHRSVFVVEGGRCRQVPVAVHESAGGLVRIDGDGIGAGVQVVHEGAHYLADGDLVEVVDSIF